MAALTAAGATRLFRIDGESWSNVARAGTLAGAALVAVGAYAILAFDRFGIQGVVAPRATVRLMLVGFYGWLWLAAAGWLIGRYMRGTDPGFATVFRLYGNAHLPLVFVGVAIQVFAVVGQILGPSLGVAALALLVWMPAMLTAATSQLFELGRRRAAMVVAAPYLVWLVTVGRYVASQLGHLL